MKFKRRFILFFVFPFFIQSQTDPVNRKNFLINISPTNEEILIDGNNTESIWKTSPIINDFFRITPVDTGRATAKTEVQLTYDNNYLYALIICYDSVIGKRPVESLRRDFSFPKNDNFIIFMDTYNDQTNGFAFGVSAAGAQWDGIQADGGDVSLDWDCKWYSEVNQYEDYWIAEFAIPFRSIRYLEGVDEWGINFSRFSLLQNEKSSWAPVPRQFKSSTLAFTGTLKWKTPPPTLGTRFSIIPYVSGQSFENINEGEISSTSGDLGMDGKITLSTSFNIDLTVNPDFSQVEVDQQRTNLDRFELFFPEKRQFFLENSDLFASLGNKNIRPFFSRRIGLQNPVKAGARISGKIGSNYRLGVMNIQTDSTMNAPSSNYTVATIQRKMLSRSSLSSFIVNRNSSVNDKSVNSYNRIVGVDFNLASADNLWTGKAFYHHSMYENATNNPYTAATSIKYNNGIVSVDMGYSFVGSGYIADVGYIKRNGVHRFDPRIEYKFYPKKGSIQNHGPSFTFETFLDEDLDLTDREVELKYNINWRNRSKFTFDIERGYVKLLSPFDPTNSGGDTLSTGNEYNWNEFSMNYQSDQRKMVNFNSNIRYGGYYNGKKLSINGNVNYRMQPYLNLSIKTTYDKIDLPDPFKDIQFILFGPKIDLTFTNKLFLTTFVQYNDQSDNININLRFQWRFAPVSDLFIVYTNNSYPDNFKVKDKALVAKVSYWFN
tara:strand:+ start:6687 stop:8837 length:2151 start_codon:yes stop_codon:yes gene_type:complete